ncbi:hypothetical protein L6164_032030 [Bauhinia variegata]|uniref:Uncharacterized protein n=1 Tax=Bauhinia variegata TaxID=167791 RepID=A0ACB9KMK6_BAUVA|nr:hypothetical protein L6164_032030 [Bauhinia variegata]
MNHKPWPWRKRSLEKTILAVEKAANPLRTIGPQVDKFSTDKQTLLEESSRSLNEKLASVLFDCHGADDPSSKQTQNSQEEITGKDKAKEETGSNEKKAKEDLGKEASAEGVTPSDATLQVSQQSVCVQEEQERRACDTVARISEEHEKIQNKLEEKLRKKSEKLDRLTTENSRLSKALLAKEKSLEALLKSKRHRDAEFSTLMARLDSTEKENAFLRYEFHMIEKELEIRKEEMGYSHQYADALRKQHLESIQKVSKLEAECQRLHLLVQKRSPGPPGLVTMKNEVGMMRRRKSNPTRDLNHNNTVVGNSREVSDRSISLIIERLQDLDEENKALKRILNKKNDELDSSRLVYAQTASRLSQAEILLKKVFEDHKSMDLARCNNSSNELPLISKSDTASEDGVSSSGSWANALISELEQLRTGEVRNKQNSKAIEAPDMSLLDDFVEMEKRAIVSVDTPKRGWGCDLTGGELVPLEQDLCFSERKQEIQFKYATSEISFDWLQIVLNAILEQKQVSKRTLDELIDDIKIALGCINHTRPYACKSDTTQKASPLGESDTFGDNSFSKAAEEKGNRHISFSLSKSIHKIIKLIEGLAPSSFIRNYCQNENRHSNMSLSPTSKEYFVHVFQWKVSELNPLLQRLVHTCKGFLTRRADFEKFVEEIAFALDWSINNCTTSTVAAIARDKIKKHFSCHQMPHENETQLGIDDPPLKLDTVQICYEESSCSPLTASPHDEHVLSSMKNYQSDLHEENKKLKDDLRNMESARKELEARLHSITDKNQGLVSELQEAQNSIKGLQSEVETMKESKGMIEDQMDHQKLINEDLDTQLTITQAKLNEFFQKFSSLEIELEDKNNSCEELEATCLELQLQLESIAKESPTKDMQEMEKISRAGWEITKASSKLAECQENILNLGKQVKALASSSEVALLERALSTRSAVANQTQKKNLKKRSSLRSQMQDEDDPKAWPLKSAQAEENKIIRDVEKPPLLRSDDGNAWQATNIVVTAPETNLTSEQNDRSNAKGAQAIVPSKKQGSFGFLRKLLLRRKNGRSKGTRS